MLKKGKDHKLVAYLERSIKSGYSPHATLQNIANEGHKFNTAISLKTFYNYIDAGLFINISNKDLLVKKDSKKRDYHKVKNAITNKKAQILRTDQFPLMHEKNLDTGKWIQFIGKQGTKTVEWLY